MRYGIFSDTHANLDALEAVLREFDKENVDALVCIGDTVGYGPQPNPCCDKVRTLTPSTRSSATTTPRSPGAWTTATTTTRRARRSTTTRRS